MGDTKGRYNKRMIMVVLILLIISLMGCSGKEGEQKKEEKDIIKIGLSMDSFIIDRWQRDRDIFVAKAKELGAEVIVQNANEDNEEQINQIKYLIDQEVDVLVVVPYDADMLTGVIKQAKKKGIKVISYDRIIRNAGVDVYISFNNVKVGELAATYLTKEVPEGNYVIVNGAKTDFNSFMINEGYKKVLEPYMKNKQIRIVKETWADAWRQEEAFKSVEEALGSENKIDAVLAGNDSLAEGAIQALAEQRQAGKVVVTGHDADLDACQRVVEGTQLMTVYKPIKILAQDAAEVAIKLAKGEEIEANNTIYDGTQNIPYRMWEPIAVTKENMVETIIEDGFHRLEDVYRNVPKSEWPTIQ